MAVETQPVTLLTSDGCHLDGDVSSPTDRPVIAAAVVCHPHPLYGGDRRNSVVDAVVRSLAVAGVVALRFDFRGVNRSEGRHGDGIAERLDVVAALDHLAAITSVPLWVVGYSFGAATVLRVDDERIAGWVAIAPPLAMMHVDGAASTDPRPKHVIIAGHDQFSPPATTLPILDAWPAATHAVLASADHFLAGHLDEVARLTTAAVTGPPAA